MLDNGDSATSSTSKARKSRSKRPLAKAAKSKKTAASRAGAMGDTSDDGDGEDNDGDGPEGDKKRARGRPRIDVSDVTAADRRRTQIRLAQRAYRNRKENAIASLEKRVEALKEANEAMTNAFMALHDFAVERGLLDTHPGLAEQLRQTTEVFLEMARQSSADEEMDENENDEESVQKYSTDKEVSQPQAKTKYDAAFRKKQKSIAEAVKTFGYQVTQHQQSDEIAPNDLTRYTATRQAQQIQEQMYGGIVMQSQQRQRHQNSPGHSPALFDDSFGPALDVVNLVSSVSTSPADTIPPSLYFGSGREADSFFLANDASSNSSATLSNSPIPSQANNDFGSAFDDPFAFDGSSLPLFPTCLLPPNLDSSSAASAPASAATGVATSNLGPHLADTDAFIAMASIGSPFPGLPLPAHLEIPNISFGLRLRQYALECAYNLINRPNPPGDAILRAFGVCIRIEPMDAIRQRLGRALENPLSPNKFTRWDLPFVTRTTDPEVEALTQSDASALSLPTSFVPSQTMASRDRCSKASKTTSNGRRETGIRTVTPLINITLPGFEGAFYDCEETDMYLQQRGVHIPPNSESIIVEVDDADFALDDVTAQLHGTSGNVPTATTVSISRMNQRADGSINGSGISSGQISHPDNRVGLVNHLSSNLANPESSASRHTTVGDEMDWNATSTGGGNVTKSTLIAAAASGSPRERSSRGTSFAAEAQDDLLASFLSNSMFSFEAQLQPGPVLPQRRLLMLDVRKLLRELVRRGTCLGQTPGFRASDVNAAFHIATRDAASI
ncbi:hypothetical protein SEPCBS57363_000452 [Sporothrix epigloea]|uniref:BZIP domain-containing protein n=1 Tax=Sporothrix epigloea TaxID=1892477 RepID=A0ABP0D4W3_9PEZI